jgi:hypothetical protein
MQKKSNVLLFKSLCTNWSKYSEDDLNEYFRVPLNVSGLNSINEVHSAEDWLDFLLACKLSGVEYLSAKRAFIKLFNI